MSFYSFTRRCRRILVLYLRQKFDEQGQTFDGTEWLTVPSCHVVDSEEYDIRQLPAIVTANAQGQVVDWSFNQVIGHWTDAEGVYGPKNQGYEVLGGRGSFTVRIVCLDRSQEVQQTITDYAGFLLSTGKREILESYNLLLGDPQLTNDGQFRTEDQEVVWFAQIMVPVSADWRALRPREKITSIEVPSMVMKLPDENNSSVTR